MALSLLFIFSNCQPGKKTFYPSNDLKFQYSGRIDSLPDSSVVLIGSASSVTFHFESDSCPVAMKLGKTGVKYNFVSLEVDGNYIERIRTEGETERFYQIPLTAGSKEHTVSIYKSTEASVGDILFCGAVVDKLIEPSPKPEKKIEFIGNSITCGVGIDWKEIPCDSGEWHDQHNSYWAYGPRVARALNLQYMLSSVSGIGMYRYWNVDEPSMPKIYENRYLNTDDSKKWDFTGFTPDVVSICLGTNDLSDGDHIHERPDFDAEMFKSNYISFIEMIYSHYPDVQVVLLSSPVLEGGENEILMICLTEIQQHFNDANVAKPISIFEFHDIHPHGGTGHPDKEDHARMADQLIPFYKQYFE